jgi:hypothetical protein
MEISFLIDVVYPVATVPCILKLVTDLYNVQDEYGQDAGELFLGVSAKIPYTVTLTTTYLSEAGITPKQDDWLIIDGVRYVIARIRPTSRSFGTDSHLPAVFSALLYIENKPEYLLDEKQPMDFIQIGKSHLKGTTLSVIVNSGVTLTHYTYNDVTFPLREDHYFQLEVSPEDLESRQVLLYFKNINLTTITKVIRF